MVVHRAGVDACAERLGVAAKRYAAQWNWRCRWVVGLSVVPSSVVVMQGSFTVEQRRERIAAAREALTGIGASLWQAPSGGGLAALLGEVDALAVTDLKSLEEALR